MYFYVMYVYMYLCIHYYIGSAISDLTSQLEGTDIAKKNEAIASLIKAWKLWDNVSISSFATL